MRMHAPQASSQILQDCLLDAQVVAAELVARTCVPPQAVLANAEADSFALAASPVQAPVAMGGAGAPAAGAADCAADMEEDTVSPRTLQQVSFPYSPSIMHCCRCFVCLHC